MANKGHIPWNKGKTGVYSAETREKMGRDKRGKEISAETRLKISLANTGSGHGMYGRQHSPETKEKLRSIGLLTSRQGEKLSAEHKQRISQAHIGKKLSDEHKAKISGENSPHWKGGITPQTIKDRNYFTKAISPLVLARDNYTCQVCYAFGGRLHVDHIRSWSEYPDLRFDVDNCRTLCRACHYYVTFKRNMPPESKWGMNAAIKGGI